MSWALKSERVGRFRKLAGNAFQTVRSIKLKERSPTDLRLRLGSFKSKREVFCRTDGRQELRPCIHSRISKAGNGVHSAVVLYGLAFVSSELSELHCSEHPAVDLFVPQANRLRQSCSN